MKRKKIGGKFAATIFGRENVKMDNKRSLNALPLLRAKNGLKSLCGDFWVSAGRGAWGVRRVRDARAGERRSTVGTVVVIGVVMAAADE